MNGTVVLVAEAGRQVGFGHLAELRAVARSLEERGVAVKRVAIGVHGAVEPRLDWLPDYRALTSCLRTNAPRVITWSVRTDRWAGVWPDMPAVSRHVWIADIADDYPSVDALVVPTLKPKWRAAQAGTRVYAGPSYFPLDVRGPREVPAPRTRPRDVLLTLGGADRTEASLRIVPALAGTKSTVVIGPGFRHGDDVQKSAAAAGIESVVAPDGLRALLLRHRIVICAGGNTLFEAAAAGTAALVAWEDPHEEAQGKSFAETGAARLVGRGADANADTVRRTVTALLRSSDLDAMSEAGRQLIDGRGADRIADLVVELARGAVA